LPSQSLNSPGSRHGPGDSAAQLLFLYTKVLDRPDLSLDAVRAKKGTRLPVVLSIAEVQKVLDSVPDGTMKTITSLLFGSGLATVKDFHDARQITRVMHAKELNRSQFRMLVFWVGGMLSSLALDASPFHVRLGADRNVFSGSHQHCARHQSRNARHKFPVPRYRPRE
jgi:hypothetical protein